jgi:DNA (cytosine-5)-methyltransferase 1
VLTRPPLDTLVRYEPLPDAGGLTWSDHFAGGGGSSTGGRQIPGLLLRYAANHWPTAILVHNANHPDVDHACVDLHAERPGYFPATDIGWFSPECTKWSQSNSTPLPDIEEGLFADPNASDAANASRLLMFDVLRYVEHHRYRVFVVENVVDIATQAKYKLAWAEWQKRTRTLGYGIRVVSLNAMHAQTYGAPAPQSRDRIYIVCTRLDHPQPEVEKILRPRAWCPRCELTVEATQAWKNGRTVGRYRQAYIFIHGACGTAVEPGWLPAYDAIDWSIPGERIGDRLKPKTRARIAAGIARYWGPFHLEAAGNTYDAADSHHRQHGDPDGYMRVWNIQEPLRSLTTTNTRGLAIPTEGRAEMHTAKPLDEPLRAQTTRQDLALVTRHNGVVGGNPARHTTPASEYLRTLTASAQQSILEPPFVAELRGGSSDARPVTDPMSTVTASGNHHGLVQQPFVTQFRERDRDLDPYTEPLRTIVADGASHALVSPAGGTWNDEARPATDPLRTLTTRDANALVTPYYGSAQSALPIDEPIGTLTTVDRYALVHRMNSGGAEMSTPVDEPLRTLITRPNQALLRRPKVDAADLKAAEEMVSECLFRMFQPHEVAAGMAFPRDYIWHPDPVKKISNRDVVKLAGNAVCPPCARDIMAVVVESFQTVRRAA